MTTKEMRELDDWIIENIPGMPSNLSPTRDSAIALLVLEKCAKEMKFGIVGIASPMGEAVASNLKHEKQGWVVGKIGKPSNFEVEAETLPLAIALFARQLFAKE